MQSQKKILDRGVMKLSKICVTCNKPFTRRKKRAKNRESVKYCSDKCKKK